MRYDRSWYSSASRPGIRDPPNGASETSSSWATVRQWTPSSIASGPKSLLRGNDLLTRASFTRNVQLAISRPVFRRSTRAWPKAAQSRSTGSSASAVRATQRRVAKSRRCLWPP